MKKFNVVSHLINVDTELEWPIYDRKGALILGKGARITSQEQLNVLRERGIYRLLENSSDAKPSAQAVESSISALTWMVSALKKCAG